MNSNSLFNSFLKGALGLTGIAMASLIPNPQKAIGAWGNIPTCPAEGNANATVSYTHLTLPTKRIV